MIQKGKSPRTCVICQATFFKWPSEPDKACSAACGAILRARNSGRKKLGSPRVCEVCSLTFYKPPSHINRWPGRTCSRTCAAKLRHKSDERQCEECEQPFFPRPFEVREGYGFFCSRECWKAMKHRLRASTRGHFRVSDKRAWLGSVCVRCQSTERLELDHIIPRFAGGPPTRENAQTLCYTCNRRKLWEEDLPLYRGLVKQRAARVNG